MTDEPVIIQNIDGSTTEVDFEVVPAVDTEPELNYSQKKKRAFRTVGKTHPHHGQPDNRQHKRAQKRARHKRYESDKAKLQKGVGKVKTPAEMSLIPTHEIRRIYRKMGRSIHERGHQVGMVGETHPIEATKPFFSPALKSAVAKKRTEKAKKRKAIVRASRKTNRAA